MSLSIHYNKWQPRKDAAWRWELGLFNTAKGPQLPVQASCFGQGTKKERKRFNSNDFLEMQSEWKCQWWATRVLVFAGICFTLTLRPSLAWQLTLSGVSKAISFSSFPLLQMYTHALDRKIKNNTHTPPQRISTVSQQEREEKTKWGKWDKKLETGNKSLRNVLCRNRLTYRDMRRMDWRWMCFSVKLKNLLKKILWFRELKFNFVCVVVLCFLVLRLTALALDGHQEALPRERPIQAASPWQP